MHVGKGLALKVEIVKGNESHISRVLFDILLGELRRETEAFYFKGKLLQLDNDCMILYSGYDEVLTFFNDEIIYDTPPLEIQVFLKETFIHIILPGPSGNVLEDCKLYYKLHACPNALARSAMQSIKLMLG